MASIIIMTGQQKGDYYPLGRRTNVIGRDEALLIQVLDKHVSRKHMQIRFDEKKEQYWEVVKEIYLDYEGMIGLSKQQITRKIMKLIEKRETQT